MNRIDRQTQELDRWENEGGALPTGEANGDAPARAQKKRLPPSAGGEVAKIGSARRGEGDFVDLLAKTAKLLKNLDEAGGHSEGCTGTQRGAMSALMRRRFVNRTIYKGGLVIYEITDAGRQYARAVAS
jgi:hypothetical protein